MTAHLFALFVENVPEEFRDRFAPATHAVSLLDPEAEESTVLTLARTAAAANRALDALNPYAEEIFIAWLMDRTGRLARVTVNLILSAKADDLVLRDFASTSRHPSHSAHLN